MGLYRIECRLQSVGLVLDLPKFIEHVRQDCGGGNLDLATSRSCSRCFVESKRRASRLVVRSRIPARHVGCPNHDSDGLLRIGKRCQNSLACPSFSIVLPEDDIPQGIGITGITPLREFGPSLRAGKTDTIGDPRRSYEQGVNTRME